MPDGNVYKGMDEDALHKAIEVSTAGADRPVTTDVLDQLVVITNFALDFWNKISASVDLLRVKAAWMATYCVNIVTEPYIGLTIFAREFRPDMQAIMKKYNYNHVHDRNLIKWNLRELTGAAIGPFGRNKIPLDPMGCGTQVYKKADERGIWA